MTEEQALAAHEAAQQLQLDGRHTEALEALHPIVDYFANDPLDLANVLCDRADSLLELCRYTEAETETARAVALVEPLLDQLDPETRGLLAIRAYNLHGRSLRELGRYPEAAQPLLTAITEAERANGPTDHSVASQLNNYGVLCKYWGRFDEGEEVYRRALAILEEIYGPDSLETATLYHNLGGLEHTRGDYAKGEPLGRKAYEIRRAALGEDDEHTIADAVAWGGLLDGLDRFDESIPIYRRALAFQEQRFGPDHF
jgi:tetratricopeptide (TPR) repeat protein